MLAVVVVALAAVPGALPERAPIDEPEPPRFTSVTPLHLEKCPQPGTVCFFAPPDVATVRASVLVGAKHARVVPIFFRVAPGQEKDPAQPWDVELVARLERRSQPGTIVVVAFDRDDPDALRDREVTWMWQAQLGAFKTFALRLHLDPGESNFRPGHVYLFRVLQLIGNQEVILAQGNVRFE